MLELKVERRGNTIVERYGFVERRFCAICGQVYGILDFECPICNKESTCPLCGNPDPNVPVHDSCAERENALADRG